VDSAKKKTNWMAAARAEGHSWAEATETGGMDR
jgi:hypothetical protein